MASKALSKQQSDLQAFIDASDQAASGVSTNVNPGGGSSSGAPEETIYRINQKAAANPADTTVVNNAAPVPLQTLSNVASGVAQDTKEAGERLFNWAEALPTPGGIALLLIVALVFVWAVVPVNGGLTRMQLAYLTLMGKTQILGESQLTGANPNLPTSLQLAPMSSLQYTVPQGTNMSTSVGASLVAGSSNGVGYQPDFGTSL